MARASRGLGAALDRSQRLTSRGKRDSRTRSRLRETWTVCAGLFLLLAAPAAAQTSPSGGADDAVATPGVGQRVVLVTGSTSGLGRAVARALAERGDHLLIHGRSEERGRALVDEINAGSPGSARFYRADFASLDEVRVLAAAVLRDYDRLDVLVNNAGILPANDPVRRESRDGHELTFQVNYLAGYLLTDLLLPLLQASAPARIVNVASITSYPIDFDDVMLERGYRGMRAYGQSKLAQVMHAIDLAAATQGTGVTANAVHPASAMDTNMIEGAGLRPRSSVMEGRDNVLLLIESDDVGTGQFFVDGRPSRARYGQPYDAAARAALRRLSEELIRR